MIRRFADNWGAIATAFVVVVSCAFGGVFWLWPVSPRPAEHPYVEAPQPYYYPGGEKCRVHGLTAKVVKHDKASQSDDCAEKAEAHRQQQESLLQAGRSARASEEQVTLLYDQTKIAAVGAFFLVLTLGATAWAAWAAFNAANAADRNARYIMHAERPFLLIAKLTMHARPSNDDGLEFVTPIAAVAIQNTGRGPATITRFQKRLTYNPLPAIPDLGPDQIHEGIWNVASGGEIEKGADLDTGAILAENFNSFVETADMRFIFRVSYVDAFKQPHVTAGCYRYIPQQQIWEPDGGPAYWEYT